MPPLRVEYAKSGKSACQLKECGKLIAKGEVRVGTANMMPGASTYSYKWRHLCCFTKRQLAGVVSASSIEGYSELAEEDQGYVAKMVKGELVGKEAIKGRVSPHSGVSDEGAGGKKKGAAAVGAKRKRSSVSPSPNRSPAKKRPNTAADDDGDETDSYDGGNGDDDNGGEYHATTTTTTTKKHPLVNDSSSNNLVNQKALKAGDTHTMTHCPFGEMCFRTDATHIRQFHSK